MAKRLMVLIGMLTLMLAAALPASAESEPRLTGVIEKPEVTTYQYGTHAITDELGNFYALESDIVDLDAYVGQRVTLSGSFVPGYENGQIEGGPPLFGVNHVEPAPPLIDEATACDEFLPSGEPNPDYDPSNPRCPIVEPPICLGQYQYGSDECPPPGPYPGSIATITYELAVECEPPADATLLGFTSGESLATTPLTDPDGDGLYTGSISLPKFAPGPVRPDTEPVSLPFRIVQGPPTGFSAIGPEFRVIEDFGLISLDGDKTLSASVSFCNGTGGGTDGSGGVVVSGDTNNNKGDSGSVDASDGAGEGNASPIAKVLPATGGIFPVVAVAGALLLAGGLLVRKNIR